MRAVTAVDRCDLRSDSLDRTQRATDQRPHQRRDGQRGERYDEEQRIAQSGDHLAEVVGVRRHVEHCRPAVEFDRARQDPVLVVLHGERLDGAKGLLDRVERTDGGHVHGVRARSDDAAVDIDELHDDVVAGEVREGERRGRQVEVLSNRLEVVGALRQRGVEVVEHLALLDGQQDEPTDRQDDHHRNRCDDGDPKAHAAPRSTS